MGRGGMIYTYSLVPHPASITVVNESDFQHIPNTPLRGAYKLDIEHHYSTLYVEYVKKREEEKK